MKPSKCSYSVMLCGDSISRGVIFDEELNKYTITKRCFANNIKQLLSGAFYNSACFGNTIVRGMKTLDNDVKKHNPDIVVIEFGGNDCDYKWDEIANNPTLEHKPNTSLKLFKETLKNVIKNLLMSNIFPVLLTLPPLDSEKFLWWVSKNNTSSKNNILKWLGQVESIFLWQEKYNEVIVSVSKETKTRCVDLRSAFLETKDYTKLLCKDGIHPNSLGHNVMTKCILQYIRQDYGFLLIPSK